MARKDSDAMAIDNIVAKKIISERLAHGWSRQQLATRIGVTHQQLQKYEKCTNRISAGRLKIIANALGKSITFFFEDDIEAIPSQHQRMSLEVSRNFSRIKNPVHQNAVNFLARTLAGNA